MLRLSDHLGKGIWGAADKFLPVVYGVGFVVLVIRVLPEIEFGNFVLVQEIFLVISGLATGFALQPLLKYVSEDRPDAGDVVTAAFHLNLAFVAASSVLVILIRGPFAALLNSPMLSDLLLFLPLLLVASFIRNFTLILLQARFMMKEVFWTDAVHFIGAVVLIIVYKEIASFDSALDLILINLISLAASSVLGLVLSWRVLGLQVKPKVEYLVLLWDYGRFSFGGILSYLFYSKADSFFLSAFTGPAQVGVYNAVKVFVRVFDTAAQVVQMFVVPAVSRFSSRNDTASLRVLVEKAIAFSTIALLPILLLFLLLAGPLVNIVYSGRFDEAADLLRLFGLLAVVTPLNAVASNALLGLGQAKAGFYISLVLLVSAAVFYSVLVPLWGAHGATIGYLLSSVVLTWMTVRKMQEFIPLTFRQVLVRANDVKEFIRSRVM